MNLKSKRHLWQKLKQILTQSTAVFSAAKSKMVDHIKAKTADIKDDEIKSTTSTTPTESRLKNHTQYQTALSNDITENDDSNTYDTSDTPIIDCIQAYLQSKQWHYYDYNPRIHNSQQSHYLSLRMRHKGLECSYLFQVQEDNELLAIYGILPSLIPESHQSAAMLLITQLNYDMLIGNLEMDIHDGEIRYKNAIDVAAMGLDDDMIEHLLQSVVAMISIMHEIFNDLINTQNPSENMPTLLAELRQQSENRTFFLPTQWVQ